MTRREDEEKEEEMDRLAGWRTRRGHLERDETWRAVEIGMERCDVETVWRSFTKSRRKGGRGKWEKFGV